MRERGVAGTLICVATGRAERSGLCSGNLAKRSRALARGARCKMAPEAPNTAPYTKTP